MTKIPVLLTGIVVLLLCVRLAVQMLRRDSGIVSEDDFANARHTLGSILIKTATINRILSDEDLKFVSRSGSHRLRRLFLKQRKMLVIHWFREIQRQVAYLMDIHLRLAAFATPSPGSELKLTVQYAIFVAVSDFLLAMFWIFGPFNARRALMYLITVIQGFFRTFRDRLERTNPAQIHLGRKSLVH